MNCRYCNQPIKSAITTPRTGDGTVTYAYWSHTPDVCHAQCKVEGIKREAFECQVIDADCNDCRHFKRGKLAELLISLTKTPDGRWVEIRHQPDLFHGHCIKFDRPTPAQPNKWTGMECFEHRRAA